MRPVRRVQTVGTPPPASNAGPPAVPAPQEKFSFRAVLPEWNLLYVGFLLFMVAIITYRFPVGRFGIIIGVVALVFSRERVRFPAPMIALTGLVLLAAIGQPGSIKPAITMKELTDGAVKTWFIALVAYNAIRTPKQFRFAVLFACALYAFVPVRPALMNYALGITTVGRVEGPFIYVNPNDLAAITMLVLGATLWVVTVEPMQKTLRLIGYGFAGTLVVLILLTQSRAGFIGLVVMGIPYAMSSARRGLRPIALIVAAIVGAAVFVPSSAWNRIAGIAKLTSEETIATADPEGSADQRYKLAQAAIAITMSNPVTGIGLGNIGEGNRRYQLEGGILARGRIAGRDAHNTYLKMSAEMGIPALILFLVMLASVWRTLTRARQSVRESAPNVAAGFGYLQHGLLGFMVASLFGSYAWLSVYHTFLALLWSGAVLWLAPNAARVRQNVAVAVDRPEPSRFGRIHPSVVRRGR